MAIELPAPSVNGVVFMTGWRWGRWLNRNASRYTPAKRAELLFRFARSPAARREVMLSGVLSRRV
jgi:hypothetical protein